MNEEKSSKKEKSIQIWDRDIVCLPLRRTCPIPYPRGKFRELLGNHGFIGKIRLMSNMTAEDVVAEIHSVFEGSVKKPRFPFTFLQSTGCGSRSLTIPSVSSQFVWTPQQVAKLGSNKGTVYIMLEEELDMEVCILILINYDHIMCIFRNRLYMMLNWE